MTKELEIQTLQPAIDVIDRNPVYLISASGPGCGSSTLAEGLAERLTERGLDPYVLAIGSALRKTLGVTDESEMQAALKDIADPRTFDPQLYGALPKDRPCIVDGKLATTVGPQYVDTNERPVIGIELSCPPLMAAKRILQREGLALPVLLRTQTGRDRLLKTMLQLENRATHDQGMRDQMTTGSENVGVMSYALDTSILSTPELIAELSGMAHFESEVPAWEIDAIRETAASLASLHVLLEGSVHPIDMSHYEHQFSRIRYNLDRLSVILDPAGLASVRADLKSAIIDCWFGLMMKEAPRFFSDAENIIIIDNESHAWTPEFYKIAEALPILNGILKGKEILDPFAGAGTLANFLVARGIPSTAVLSDIAFAGGKPINEAGHRYRPRHNGQIARLLFDNLPSWYKPDFTPIKGYIVADARNLPMKDGAVDFVVADPPYGKNCTTGGLDLLLNCIDEFKRVAREGSLLMIPIDWIGPIQEAGHQVVQLTKDVSRGHSNLPVCYILIKNK